MPNIGIETLQSAVQNRVQLCSIFDRITESGGSPPVKRKALEACILTGQNIVSCSGGISSELLSEDLSRLLTLHEDAHDETYYYLLQKYGWRIGQPNGEEIQDIAFCDAIRIKRLMSQSEPSNSYLLVKGDLSGIQDYIYGNIQQKTAGGLAKLSKRLRGRSILVTLLTDFLANITLRELKLPVWNLLFAGGGHFNLLIPNTQEVREALDRLERELDAEMQRIFGNRLHLVLSSIECTQTQISSNAGVCFGQLNAALERKKQKQHQGRLNSHFYGDGMSETDEQKKRRDDKEIEIGRTFPSKTLIVEAVGGIFNTNDRTHHLVTFRMSNHHYSMLAFEKYEQVRDELVDSKGLESAQVFFLNNTEFIPKDSLNLAGQIIGFGFRFIGKYVPRMDAENPKTRKIEKRPLTFEEIAHKDGLEMLGAIRLDVDDLGYIFSHGMKDATLAQIVTLSREMHYFFSAHFDKLAEEHGIYLIYSGGDDAFAVGQWSDLISFTQSLHRDFEKFTFGNKYLHFSAGVFLGDPKYPVGRFYLDAGELLSEAKKSNDEKNRIHLFHNITDWAAFDEKIKFGVKLSAMLNPKDGEIIGRKLSMSFAYRLLTLMKTSFYERADMVDGRVIKRGNLNSRRFARNISSMRYLFARHGYDDKKIENLTNEVEKQLINDYLRNFKFGGSSNEKSIRDNLIALNYALYLIRSQKNNQPQHG